MIDPRDLPDCPRLLVITLRRLGDTLLTTPLLRALRRGFPQATLDMLAFAGSDRIVQNNPDINNVIAIPERMSPAQGLALARRLWRRYDLAISTQAGDRPTFLALLAGRRRIGLVPHRGETGAWWKARVYDCPVQPGGHRVEEVLRLASALGLAERPDVVCPRATSPGALAPQQPYAVLHASPMYRYKQWPSANWRTLAHALAARGLALAATGGPEVDERCYLDALWNEGAPPIKRLDGRLDWSQFTALLAGAAIYVGPDTSMTHLAAAAGCPTVALYGPTDPRLWGPWPVGGLAQPWEAASPIQRRGNVWLVQNVLPCTPCQKEGCERHRNSHSQCLEELPVGQVLSAVDQALAWGEQRQAAQPGWRDGAKFGMQSMPSPTARS